MTMKKSEIESIPWNDGGGGGVAKRFADAAAIVCVLKEFQ